MKPFFSKSMSAQEAGSRLAAAFIAAILLFCLATQSVLAQTTGSSSPSQQSSAGSSTSGTGGTSTSASGSTGGASSSGATGTSVLPSDGGLLSGRWIVDKAIYDYLGALKQVEAGTDQFYAELSFGPSGKGTITYGKTAQPVAMEYALRNNQDLTIAFGSLLKPQTDLFRVVFMSDGTIFLRSTRMALANGTVFYLLRRGQ